MDWQTIITVICATGIPSAAFTAVIGSMLRAKEERGRAERLTAEENEKRDRAVQGGLRALLRLELRRMHDEYTSRGWMTAQDYGLFINAYGPYRDLGGNGIATAYLEDVRKLPIRD